jgi:predicted nucleic acid-binding protein
LLICDTSGLVAYFDTSDAFHAPVRDAVESEGGFFVVSPFVLAELDYLLATRRNTAAEVAALTELGSGAWDVPTFDLDDLRAAVAVIERYRDQAIGLTDASLVVLADRFRTRSVLTLDHRHFDVLRPLSGGRFRLLP